MGPEKVICVTFYLNTFILFLARYIDRRY